jgi:hypothetical protein
MDHNNFETNMIDFVNLHSQAKAVIYDEARREQMETAAHQRRKKATKAVIEYILWVAALIGIVLLMSFVYTISFVPAKVAILASSLFAFIAGMRINVLAMRIARYGGR